MNVVRSQTPSKFAAAVAVVVGSSLTAAPAAAQAPGSTTPLAPAAPVHDEEPVTVTHSYASTVRLVDLASAGMVLVDTQLLGGGDAPMGTGLGLGGLLLAAPTVHFVKGNWRGGLASLGLRILLPAVGGALGETFGPPDAPRDNCPTCERASTPGLLVGLLGGLVVASALDARFLAKRTEQRARWAPTLSAASRGVTLGAAGRF
ncbi:MAG: hypothetical protein M3680_15060 [Myxococcota bacterium]|nr:hypothetical protein [Myxococcota bacterium]